MPAHSAIRFCVPVEPSAPPDAMGGKARSLLSLRAAGLPVPPAFAVTTALFAELRRRGPGLPAQLDGAGALAAIEEAVRALRGAAWPDGFAEQLRASLASLPGESSLSVRSSAAIEDDPAALGAGLYQSRVGVAPAEVEAALREVLATALSPAVVAYLGARGHSVDERPMAVLIHPFVAGTAAGTAALDDGGGARPIIEGRGAITAPVRARLEAALVTLVGRHGPVEVEWVAEGDVPLFLQLRPFRAGQSRRARAAEPDWRWDAGHNPLPLSPAQAGLVAFVDARCAVPFEQRVTGGYLFYRSGGNPGRVAGARSRDGSFAAMDRSRPWTSRDDSAGQSPAPSTRPRPTPADTRAALNALEARAAERLARPEPLDAALDTFAAIYEPLFAVVQPAARAAREALAARLAELGRPADRLLGALVAGVDSAATARAAAAARIGAAGSGAERAAARAAYVATFGDEAPVWDVAVPTWREAPDDVPAAAPGDRPAIAADANAAAEIGAAMPVAERPRWEALVAAARDAAAVAEDDDALYARAQAHVRRALLAEGERLRAAGTLARAADVFWLPFELVRRLARGEATLARPEADRLLEEARAADQRARAAPPALDAAPLGAGGALVRGRAGSPGARVGIVRHWPLPAPTDAAEPPVLVARTILPTELPLIAAVALVVETGGVLDHVAAQARERGIPAVVGAAGALAALADGDRVLVDGDAGLVVRV